MELNEVQQNARKQESAEQTRTSDLFLNSSDEIRYETTALSDEARGENSVGAVKPDLQRQWTFVDDKPWTVQHWLNVYAKHDSDLRSCYVAGLAALDGFRLFIVDYRYYIWGIGNASVKLADLNTRQVVTQMQLSSTPADVTKISDTRVAVTVPYDKKIVFIIVGNTALAEEKELPVGGNCYGIDYRDGRLAVSLYDSNSIQVMTLDGTVLHTIKSDVYGRALFARPYYVVFGAHLGVLYVSNDGDHSVVCVGTDGAVTSRYQDSELRNPRALVCLSNGDVYVCAEGSKNVHRISPDCKKIQLLLSKDALVSKPCSICYSDIYDLIFIGMWNNAWVRAYRATLQN